MNKKNPLANTINSLTLASAMVATGIPIVAFAQSETEIEEVVVTGSRIQRDDLSANSPIEIISQAEIRATNTTNLEEFLRKRPQFTQAFGANTNNGNPGAATVDLRNLGEERTLVLVNGKRFTPYDYYGAVDLSMIPVSLVKRVEVVTGGASAVYGTDAIAGVVNFIMEDSFEGAEFDASTFSTTENDAKRQDYSMTLGTNFANDRGNIVFNAGFTDQDALTQAERDYSFNALDPESLSPLGSSTAPEGSVFSSTYPGDPTEGFVQFDEDSNAVAPFASYNFNPLNLFQTPQDKKTATLLGHFDVSDSLRAYGRLSYAKNEVDTIIAPTGTFFFPFELDLNNPYLGPDAIAHFSEVDAWECSDPVNDADGVMIGCDELAPTAGDGMIDILLGRRLVELGNRNSSYENETLQYVFGLEGELNQDAQWEAFAQYGKTDRQQKYSNDASYARALEAFNAVPDGGGGVACASGNPDCAPANFFGVGNLASEAASFIRLDVSEANETEQWVVGGSLTGNSGLTVPSADSAVSYAVGFEMRRDEGRARPDANYGSGDAIGFGSSSPVDAEIEIQEFFGESMVPVLSSVTLELGARYSRYENSASFQGSPTISNDFSNTSYKIGADWQIIDDLRARVMYQHAVRAPNLAEIGLPLTPSIGDLDNDPCEGTVDPALQPLCLATGVPGGSVPAGQSIIAGQIGNFLGGNPELEPEEADTYTVGVVWTPAVVPGLEMSVDYYDITIENVITQLSEQEIVNRCYSSGSASSESCERIRRSPLGGLNAGSTVGVDVSLVNSAEETTKGWDFDVSYGMELADLGSLTFGLVASYTAEHEFQSSPGADTYDCAGLVGATCVRPDPEWRWTQSTTWQMNGLRVDLIWRYLDELTQDSIEISDSSAADWAEPTIDAYSYFNLAASYAVNDTWTVRGGVDNLFDKEPPIVGIGYGGTAENSGNTFPSTYDVLGRAYFLGVNASF